MNNLMDKDLADVIHLGLLRWHKELNRCRRDSRCGLEACPYMCHIAMDLADADRITMDQLIMALDRIQAEIDPWYSLYGYLGMAQGLPSSPLARFCWYRKWMETLYENRAAVLRDTSE